MRRLLRTGFDKGFLAAVILPDWWDEECWAKVDLLPEFEFRVARFLGLPLSAVTDPDSPLTIPAYAGARLRRVRDIDRDRLAPAIHSALRIAEATVRNLAKTVPPPAPPAPNGLQWREEILGSDGRVTADGLLNDLWRRGIPVVPIDELPSPSFQGLAAIVNDRPVIVVGHNHDEPGRVIFLVAHETAHIASADCTAERPVVDQDEEIASEDEMETAADQFAVQVLVGGYSIPQVTPHKPEDFKDLAQKAVAIERRTGADASSIIFSWARTTGDYATATMATKALYRAAGGRSKLREYFQRFVALESAPESDRELLRAVVPDHHGRDAPVG